jgi:hypothetical protein
MDYEYRYVSSGASTPIEDDDTARYFQGTVFALDGSQQPSADGYVAIIDGGDPGGALWALCNGPATLAAKQADGQSGTILFDDLTKATEMSSWLAATKRWSIGTTGLSVMGGPSITVPSLQTVPGFQLNRAARLPLKLLSRVPSRKWLKFRVV